MTKEDVLHRWSEALGGLDALRQMRGLHLRAVLETGGMQGTYDEWIVMGGRRRCQTDVGKGLVRNVSTFDGQKGWTCGLDTRPIELAGADLRDEINQVYLGTFSHLVPGRRPGPVEFLGEDAKDENLLVIRAAPEGGNTITWYLDKTRFLPVRMEEPEGDRTRVIFFDDWRTVGGVNFPFQLRQSIGDTQYDAVVYFNEVDVNPSLEQVHFGRPADPPKDWTLAVGVNSCTMPFELCKGLIFLQTKINDRNRPLGFILDSGASVAVINASAAVSLGLQYDGNLEGRGAGSGSVATGFMQGVSFHWPKLSIVNQRAAVMPQDMVEPSIGRKIDGVLGYEVFSRLIVEVDYAAKRLTFHDPASFTYSGHGIVLPILIQGLTPHVRAEIVLPSHPPIEGLFLVDSGGSCGHGELLLATPFVNKHHLASGLRSIQVPMGHGIGGQVSGRLARATSLRLGNLSVKEPVIGLSSDTGGGFASLDSDGLITTELLRRFKVIFDYPHQRMILEPTGDWEKPGDIDMSGLELAAEAPDFRRFQVTHILESSPAAEAKIQVGDRIVAVDDRPAQEFSLDDLRCHLVTHGRQVRLTIQRGNRQMTVLLTLRRLI